MWVGVVYMGVVIYLKPGAKRFSKPPPTYLCPGVYFVIETELELHPLLLMYGLHIHYVIYACVYVYGISEMFVSLSPLVRDDVM